MSSVSANANAINARGGPRQKTRYLPTTLRPASANPPVSGTRHARLGVLKPAELSCVVNESGLPFGRNRSHANSLALQSVHQLRARYAEHPCRGGKIALHPRNCALQQQRFNVIQRRRVIVFADPEKQVGHLF